MPEIIWKDIKGYEGLYQVNNLGQIKSFQRKGRILKPGTHPQGYKRINLCKDGVHISFAVHRLVGEAFINNPDNLPEINHIDEVKDNNSVENLEWVTSKQNNNHGTKIERCIALVNKKVSQINSDGIVVHEFDSIKQAGMQVGVYPGNICKCCKGKAKTSHGYRWQYA